MNLFKCKSCGSEKAVSLFYANPKLIRGHYATCRACWDERARKWRNQNWPSAYSTRRDYKQRNRDRVASLTRKSQLKVKYGMTVDAYNELFSKQGGVCAICGLKSTRPLCVDHCHASGKIRGLLCDKCNRGIGCFKDDPELMIKAAEFIQAGFEALADQIRQSEGERSPFLTSGERVIAKTNE